MIKLVFGNVGSGKTAIMVRYMKTNKHKMFITNIHVKGKEFKNVIQLKADMIIKKDVIGIKRDGTEIFKLSLNTQFWKDLILKYGEMNIIIDEAHAFGLNPRRSMSSINLIMTDFIALIRRVLGSSDNSGDAYFISQLSRRLDPILRDMSEQITFCIHHYTSKCSICKSEWVENNEMANKFTVCPRCKDYRIKKVKHIIEVFEFKNINDFIFFREAKTKTYYSRYLIKDIETIFGNYDTLQFEDLLSNY